MMPTIAMSGDALVGILVFSVLLSLFVIFLISVIRSSLGIKCSNCAVRISFAEVGKHNLRSERHPLCSKCRDEKLLQEKIEAGWLFDAYTWQTPEVSSAQYVTSGPLIGALLNAGMSSFQPAGFYLARDRFWLQSNAFGASDVRWLNWIFLGPPPNPNSSMVSVNEVSEVVLAPPIEGGAQKKDAKSKGLIAVKFLLPHARAFQFCIKQTELSEIKKKLAPFGITIPSS